MDGRRVIWLVAVLAVVLVGLVLLQRRVQRDLRAATLAALRRPGRPVPLNLSRRALIGYLHALGYNPRART